MSVVSCLAVAFSLCTANLNEIPIDLVQEEFTKICAVTELDCGNVTVRYNPLKRGIAGQAVEYNTGRMEIWLNPDLADNSQRLRNTLVHEVAHLIMYSKAKDPASKSAAHNSKFQLQCRLLKLKVHAGPSTCLS